MEDTTDREHTLKTQGNDPQLSHIPEEMRVERQGEGGI